MSVRSCSRSRKYGSVWRCSFARASFCTRSTAASAVKPELTASRNRRSQPRSWAIMRKASSTSRRSPVAPSLLLSMRLSTEARIAPIAVSRRWSSEFHVVGYDLRHRHARLVHHDMSKTEPVGDAETFQRQRPTNGDRRALGGDALQLSGRDHLGEQHRGRLQRLDLLFGIGPPRAILHDQHPDRAPLRSTGTPRNDW